MTCTKKIIFILLALICLNGYSSTSDSIKWDLEKVSSWVLKQIRYPEDAYQKSKTAGIEQFCISLTWDGRVFLSYRPYTLHPSFEDEIKRIIRSAPHCDVTAQSVEESYKYMTVDFYEYLPIEEKKLVERIPHYMPPRFAAKGQKQTPFNGRENFMEWIYKNLIIPEELPKGITDTLSIEYTINKKGHIENVNVVGDIPILSNEVHQVICKAPHWTPAVTVEKKNISITCKDKLIVNTDITNGKKLSFIPFIDEVYANSNISPSDSDLIVMNPEKKAIYLGSNPFLKDLSEPLKRILKEKEINEDYSVSGSFVIEKNGCANEIKFNCLPILDNDSINVENILRSSIEKMRRTAAYQGSVPVRSIYNFAFVGHKKTKRPTSLPDYEIFGKYVIPFLANPAKIPYGYIQKDGSMVIYPFTPSGLFNNKEYHKGLFYYQKYKGKGNVSKRYWDKISNLYIQK